MTYRQPRTYTPPVRYYIGDDAFISADLDKTSEYSTDVHIRDADHHTVSTLHLSPFGVRELRDALTRCLVGLESATIEPAIPVTDDDTCDICGTSRSSHRGPSRFTRRVPGNTFPAMNTSVTS